MPNPQAPAITAAEAARRSKRSHLFICPSSPFWRPLAAPLVPGSRFALTVRAEKEPRPSVRSLHAIFMQGQRRGRCTQAAKEGRRPRRPPIRKGVGGEGVAPPFRAVAESSNRVTRVLLRTTQHLIGSHPS